MRATRGGVVGAAFLAIGLGLSLLFVTACDSSNPSIRIPIPEPNRNGFAKSFTVPRTAVYSVGLEFATPIADPEVDRLVDLAASRVGFPDFPTFDFGWRVIDDTVTIGQGSGRDGATGVVITNAEMISKAEALMFGTFDACAGRTYVLNFSPGSDLTRVLSVSPVVLIDIHHTLENDGRIHDDGPRLEQVCASRMNKAPESGESNALARQTAWQPPPGIPNFRFGRERRRIRSLS